jgi:GT2 family glycosyltransferase
MEQQKTRLMIGFLTYGEATAKYLPYFLRSLQEQTFQDFSIMALDNTPVIHNANHQFITEHYPDVKLIWHGKNMGFAKGYNELIKYAVNAGAEYFLVLNPDMLLEPTALAEMVAVMDTRLDVASVSPKVLKWDFVDKSNILDTLGIKLLSGLRFVDLGQGEVDSGQYDQAEILGPSGCAGLYRVSALEKIKIDAIKPEDKVYDERQSEYFDELFFMYKEDCDLAYRLQLAGQKSAIVPSAIIYHDRTAASIGNSNVSIALNRRNKSKQVRLWSFWGQQVLFKKYFGRQKFGNKLRCLIYQCQQLIWAHLFERYLLAELKQLKLHHQEIVAKRAMNP